MNFEKSIVCLSFWMLSIVGLRAAEPEYYFPMDGASSAGCSAGSVPLVIDHQVGLKISPGRFGHAVAMAGLQSEFWTHGLEQASTPVDYSNFTLSFHLKMDSVQAWKDVVSIGSDGRSLIVECTDTGRLGAFSSGKPGGHELEGGATGGRVVTDGQWHHVAMVVSKGVLTLYVDAGLVGTLPFAGAGKMTSFQLGSRLGDGSRASTVMVDDVAIFSRDLSHFEVAELSENEVRSIFVPETSEVRVASDGLSLVLRRSE